MNTQLTNKNDWYKMNNYQKLYFLKLLAELNLIDDLLTLQKAQSLLNRKRNLKAQLEARIGLELGHNVPNLNAR